ncbi:MAG: hypothetical protein LUC98_08695 [Lachnospiraceae bacterium]|nr:hypothetical protein [Lachnospiraceae bacterium]
MIEIYVGELRMDEKALQYTSDEEIRKLREIAGNIAKRSRTEEQQAKER